jgi:hypothetical protein
MTLFAVAALIMALIAAIHIVMGGRTDAAALLASDIPEPARSTLFYCWHFASIVLVAMTIAFALAAADDHYRLLALAATGLAAAFALWGVFAGLARRQSLVTQLPQGLMFALVTVVAAAGLGL